MLRQKYNHDLRIYGDDIDEFSLAYSREFKVDLKDFPFDQYFPGEGEFFRNIKSIFVKVPEFKPLSIQDLATVARKGKLDG